MRVEADGGKGEVRVERSLRAYSQGFHPRVLRLGGKKTEVFQYRLKGLHRRLT